MLIAQSIILTSCNNNNDIFPRAEIKKINSNAIYFEGYIQDGDDRKLTNLMDRSVKKLIIKSYGGEVTASIKLALLIHENNLSIKVEDVCASSCANYVFLAGKQKLVPRGSFVGFHGDPLSSGLKKNKASRKSLAQMNYEREVDKLEKSFNSLIQVDRRIFTHSIDFTRTNKVSLWSPSPRELSCLGVKNLRMWHSSQPQDFNLYESGLVATTAQDTRKPRPDVCNSN